MPNPSRIKLRPGAILRALALAGWIGAAGLGTFGFKLRVAGAVEFAKDIRPLLNKQCVSCHGGVKRAGGVSFLSLEGAVVEGKSGRRALVPGSVESSELIRRITATDPADRMPPPEHGPALSATEIETLREWVRTGARWTRHWAYEKPRRPELPAVKNTSWPAMGLDRFILARLEHEGLAPAKEASRRAWLRRVSLDLIGLPPTEDDAAAFLQDATPRAYENVVDRLLASPHFGERWASVWLDLARYADTMGYERDFSRVVWPWRDWVVRAWNDDLGYDEFVRRQLAGDLLPNASDDDRLATAFHRNTQTNTEDGTDDEEFRLAAVMDRISTTWEGLAATSFRCAQCHNHPYDPFNHEEYYRVAAIFNTTRDHDANEEFPLLRVPEKESDRPQFWLLDEKKNGLRRRLHAEGMALAEKTRWQRLEATAVQSTGQASVAIRKSPADGESEVVASGTISLHSVYTVDASLATGRTVTALRLEVLPDDEETAASIPELGFVLSRLQMQVLAPPPSTNVVEIPLVGAYDEDPDASFPVEASLNPDAAGWSAYPRFHHKRLAVFVPGQPVVLSPGARLRLLMAHDIQSSGIKAQAIRRLRLATSEDAGWTRLAEGHAEARSELSAMEKTLEKVPSVRVPVMMEQPLNKRRETRVFKRGNWLHQAELVQPGVPAVFGSAEVRSRLDFAQWLTSPDHPLFARVAVNRFWEQLFGLGLVASSEEFGTTGQEPSHSELLDWLAVRFATELRFSPKKLLRELALSATYRQDSGVSKELNRRDPLNRLLARGPRQRLTAEMVRDQALAVSGLLSRKMGGPPVMPVQPEGIWRTVYNGGKWVTSPGEDAHRRALYTFIRRTSGYPSFQTFDGPSREFCTVRRLPTNTPLQALVTLNDPVYLEAAQGLARRMAADGKTPLERIGRGWLLAAGRPARAEELRPLLELLGEAEKRFEADALAAASLAATPELASLTVVANALLNLDVVLTR